MNPFIILAIIGTVVSVIWAGVSSVVYNVTGVNIPWLSFIPKFPLDFSSATIPNPSLNNTDSLPSFDYEQWIKNTPIQGIIDYVSGGVGSLISWITPAIQNLFQSLVWIFCKTCVLPDFFGILVTALIIIIFFVMMWSQVWELLNKFGIIVLVVVVIIIVIVVVLSLLGVLQ